MVHPAGGRRRVRLRDGGRAGSQPPALRREAPLGLPRRGEQAVDRRGGRADPGRAGPAGAVRLRVYPQRDGQPVHDQRTVARWAGGEGDRASDGGGLRRGGALAGRGGARGGGESGAGDGQLEHAQAGVAVRGVPAGAGPADRREAGDPPHPEAWQLAEHGGDRAVGAVPAVPVASDRDEGGAGTRGGGVGGRAERAGRRGAVALHYCGCSNQAPQALPNNLRLAVYYINAELVCALLRAVAAAGVRLPITLVLDNARYQKCAVVQAPAASLRIELLSLPGYSPNLNLIERLWRFLRKQSLDSMYYEDFSRFTAAIDRCLDDLPTAHKGEMETLLTHRFQTFGDVPLLAA